MTIDTAIAVDGDLRLCFCDLLTQIASCCAVFQTSQTTNLLAVDLRASLNLDLYKGYSFLW